MNRSNPGFLRPTWARAVGLGLLALTLSVVMNGGALWSYPGTQGGDGAFYHRVIEAARVSISRYHELPLWNAYECGGEPLWDNPQSLAGAPIVLLMLGFTATMTMRVWYVLHHAFGFVGMWLFARHDLKLSRPATFVASTIFALTAAHGSQYGGGHATFVPFLYAPLALLLWRRAEDDPRCGVGMGLLFAWMFYEGGIYPVPHFALMLAFETLLRLTSPSRALRILRAGVIVSVVFVSVAGARLFPVVDQVMRHKRLLSEEHDTLSLRTLGDMYFARTHEWHVAGQEYVWPEFRAYLGGVVVTLALVGLALSIGEETWFFVLGAFIFALMLGHFASWAPWHVLKTHVFPWKSMRVPSRFRLMLLVFLGGWVGFAIDRLPPLVGRWLGRRVGAATATAVLGIALLGAGDAVSVSMDTVGGQFNQPPEQVVTPSQRLYIGGPGMAAFIDQPRQNRGRLDCWEEWNFTQGAPQWQGDVPQARSANPDALTVARVTRTQNTFTIDVDAKQPGRVLVNVPYEAGWRTDVGKTADQDKLLVLDVPAGRATAHLRYWPRGFTLGLFTTSLGLAGSIAYFVWDARRRRRVDPGGATSASPAASG